MKCNLAWWDRTLRFLLGILMMIYAIAGGPLWSWLGLYLLGTSSWGWCPLYATLKIRTIHEKRPGRIP